MGRKSRAEEQREVILAAFERCIVRYGIDASLEQIAEEAGMQRSLIRHYLGNRDELVSQLIARIAETYPERVAEQLALAVSYGEAGVIEMFIRAETSPSTTDDVILAVANTAQGRYPQAKQQLAAMLERIIDQIAIALGQLFPGAPPTACQQSAYALLCISQTHEALLWLGLNAQHTESARAAVVLLLHELAAADDAKATC